MKGFLIAFLVLPLSCLSRGLLLSKCWAWFVVSAFSLPQVTIIQASGMMLLFSYMTYKPDSSKPTPGWQGVVVNGILLPLFILLMAFILQMVAVWQQ